MARYLAIDGMGVSRDISFSEEASVDREAETSSDEEMDGLILAYGEKLLRYAVSIMQNHQDAEDVVQDVFIAYFQNAGRFDIRNISAWLYKMTYNHCLNRLKEIKRRKSVSLESMAEEPAVYMRDSLLMPEIMRALKRLKPQEIALLYGRAVEAQSYEELSQIMGRPAAALRKQYERVKKKAIKHLNAHGYDSVESLM